MEERTNWLWAWRSKEVGWILRSSKEETNVKWDLVHWTHRLQFQLKYVYHALPTPTNLATWGMKDDLKCKLCRRPANLEQILYSCSMALTDRRFSWRWQGSICPCRYLGERQEEAEEGQRRPEIRKLHQGWGTILEREWKEVDCLVPRAIGSCKQTSRAACGFCKK